MKARLREKYLNARLLMSRGEAEAKSVQIQKRAMENEEYVKARRISLYLASEGEAKTELIVKDCLRKGKETYVATIKGKSLAPVRLTESTRFAKGRHGTNEPQGDFAKVQEFDVIIIPLVAFDLNRNRLGRGGGHYDRYLKANKGYRIGLGFDIQQADSITAEPHDQKLDAIITETRTIC